VSEDSIRHRIEKISEQLAHDDISPSVARTSLIQITALLGNCMTEARHADHEYKLVLLGCMAGGEPANRAKIRAEVSEQYVTWRAAQDLVDLVIELIRSLKVSLKSKDEEMRFTPR
jgi:hypothetical protein